MTMPPRILQLRKYIETERKKGLNSKQIFGRVIHKSNIKAEDIKILAKMYPKFGEELQRYIKSQVGEAPTKEQLARQRKWERDEEERIYRFEQEIKEKRELESSLKKIPKYLQSLFLNHKISEEAAIEIDKAMRNLEKMSPELAVRLKSKKEIFDGGSKIAIQNIQSAIGQVLNKRRFKEHKEILQTILPFEVTNEIAHQVKDLNQAKKFAVVLSKLKELNPNKANEFIHKRNIGNELSYFTEQIEKQIDTELKKSKDTKLKKKRKDFDVSSGRGILLNQLMKRVPEKLRAKIFNLISRMPENRVFYLINDKNNQDLFIVTLSQSSYSVDKAKKDREGVLITTSEEAAKMAPIYDSNFICEDCGYKGAEVKLMDTFADEPPIIIHKCPHCGKGHRDRQVI